MGRRDDLMLKIDSGMMTVSNFISRINPKNIFYNEKRNKQLVTQNDTCFVIGNGPSLTRNDLTLITNYDAINVNFFFEGSSDFEGKYLVLIDPGFCNEHGVEYLQKCANTHKELKLITSTTNYHYFIENKAFPQDRMFSVNLGLKQHGMYISTDICKMITGSLNIIPVAIEIAIGLGYRNIYLLGCDFSFYGSKDVGKHFYDKTNSKVHESYNSVGNLIRCSLVQQHHFAIANYCNKNNLIIKNLTPGSLIMAYEPDLITNIINNGGK